MNAQDSNSYHQFYGEPRRRTAFKKKDIIDYTIMSALCMLVVYFAYGADSLITKLGIALGLWMMVAFPLRHGWELSMPVILKRPQELLHMVLYKVRNLKWMYLFALGVLLLENYLIYLTPNLPHRTALMHSIALYLFYFHIIALTAYRTYILYVHLREKDHVREVLMQTVWQRKLQDQPSIVVEILHAYFTGLLTHIILVAPWFVVITYSKFSILFMPVVCALNVFTQAKYLKVLNAWYYRDHWLSHNSETEFIYLHGSHHDAIPSGLIGVAGNGLLEGITRHALAAPTSFFNPVISTLIHSYEIKGDIDAHQYIPGLYPKADIERQKIAQHSMHHFGRLQPFGFGMSVAQPGANPEYVRKLKYLPEELKNSIRLEEHLDGFEWNNKMHTQYLELVSKYEKSE